MFLLLHPYVQAHRLGETLWSVVEVLSPSTARYDRLTKRTRYQRQGVEYWILDLDGRVIERWMPSDERPEILAGDLLWHPPEAGSPLLIEIERYFAEALDRA